MQLHELKSSAKKSRQRIGRGGKRGTTSGRGTKGQKSRAGRRIRPAIRDLIIRLPKRRGSKNKSLRPEVLVINLEKLDSELKKISGGKEKISVSKLFLKTAGLQPVNYKGEIKILGDGEISLPIIIEEKEIKLSKTAREKIKKAGGQVIANSANKTR